MDTMHPEAPMPDQIQILLGDPTPGRRIRLGGPTLAHPPTTTGHRR